MLTVLGVRHHGPGSARSVVRALDELQPAVVVIEGPPELDSIVPLAADPGLKPPVAGLVYDVKTPRRASFYPMAIFSPEWVALRWAINNNATVRFADLPAANRLAEPEEPSPIDLPEPGLPEDRVDERIDPIGALAAAAGYDDAERWWEDAIEQRRPDSDVLERFVAIGAAMQEFRPARRARRSRWHCRPQPALPGRRARATHRRSRNCRGLRAGARRSRRWRRHCLTSWRAPSRAGRLAARGSEASPVGHDARTRGRHRKPVRGAE